MSCEHLLDYCGCCTTPPSTPAAVGNTPGRPALERRVGTSGQFAATMAAKLTAQAELAGFTNRRTDDPAIALVDAWAGVLDVLTFYTERLTNEGYLRTATDPRSLTELAHSVGYVPGRGRASATDLAFTLEDAPGSPTLVPIPAGTKVASLPGPGEVPQNYETSGDVEARPEWNAIRARTRMTQQVSKGATSAYVDGVRTDLTPGDAILVVGNERAGAGASAYWAFRLLASVRPDAALGATLITWVEPLGSPSAASGRQGAEKVPNARDLRIVVLRKKAAIFGANAPDYRLINQSASGGKPDPKATLAAAFMASEKPKESQIRRGEVKGTIHQVEEITGNITVGRDWPGFTVRTPDQPENTVDLDTTYPTAVVGSWAVLTRHGVTACYEIVSATEESRTDFTLNAKVTRLSLDGPFVGPLFSTYVRQTTAWVGSDLVPLSTSPIPLPVQGFEVELAKAVPTLEADRTVVVRGPRPRVRVVEGVRSLELKATGKPVEKLHPGDELEVVGPVTANADGSATWTTTRGAVTAPAGVLEVVTPDQDAVVHSEVATVAGPTPGTPTISTLKLAKPLAGCFDRDAVRILANVAAATHGETKTQVLGSGNAASTYQRFALSQAPLTYVSASGGTVISTLQVRVDGRLWAEVPQLFGSGPDDEVFTTQMDDEGKVTVLFGDGRTGARLPTGTNNVTATYRVGTGLEGRVAADQLTLPMTRPLGLRSVTNPVASGLAADPEAAGEIRANAPRTALALERVVSLRDVEDFAHAVPGIGKALASWLWDGQARFVHLTVSGTGSQSVDTQAIKDLKTALLAAGDARLSLRVDQAEVVTVYVTVAVVVDPAYDAAVVLEAVRASVTTALAVEARTLGQPLTGGDIILAAHAAAGVVAVNVTVPKDDVPSAQARMSGGQPRPAELVVLAPGGLKVSEATP